MAAKHGFILATIHSPASVHDTNFLQYCTIFSRHTNKPIKIVYPVKSFSRKRCPNRIIEIGESVLINKSIIVIVQLYQ